MTASEPPPNATAATETCAELRALDDQALAERVDRLLTQLEEHVLGQRAAAEQVLVGYMAGGHVLIEGVPGIGKTLLARILAALLGLRMTRVQFTPDLMPADLTGTNVFDAAERRFRLIEGPVFTDLLMADEINRTPPKTQAALLEAMQEGQVTIDGTSHRLPTVFFVIATQNPVEFEGTYPLPEAQADRFLLKVAMDLPAPEHELDLLRLGLEQPLLRSGERTLPAPVLAAEEARALRRASRRTHVAPELLGYLQALAQGVRQSSLVELGVSPRAVLSLAEAARAGAWIEGRSYVTPDDVQRFLVPCWRHRILLTAEAELEGSSSDGVLEATLREVPVPRSGGGGSGSQR